MKTKSLALFAIVLLGSFGISAHAEDLRKIISLSGSWKFSIGDDIAWANPSYDDSNWDQISIPEKWENQGYDDYNGYAWYRKKFRVEEVPNNSVIYLILGRIDDADVVYLNGKVLGKSGKFPPDFMTAYNRERKYVIPAGYLKAGSENVIAVCVYDSYLEGGIIDGPVGLFVDADNDFLSLNFNGKWKFHTGDNKAWVSPDFNDNDWKSVYVPSVWENQGFEGYDGYAWYRISFRLPENFNTVNMYISLGKIDDFDDVYLNGKNIGNVYDLRKDNEYRHKGWEYNARRLYRIPEGLLSKTGINTVAVRVYDGQIDGGIYEGPVGLMSAENYKRYKNKHYSDQSFWDYWFDKFIIE